MLKEGDKLICKTKGLPETEFCIRGVVKSVVGDKVTISRALKFGQLPMYEDLTLPEEELLKYYTLMDESEASTQGMIYEVTVSRFGFVFVSAESAAAAMELADHLTTEHISWSDDWMPTDAKEHADYDGTVFTEPDFD